MKVANPFANALTFTADRTRTRRDHMKYLALIKAIALLHQFQRKTITRATSSGRQVVMLPITIEDIEAANKIAPDVLGRSLDELPPQTRRLLETIKAIVRERIKKRKACQENKRKSCSKPAIPINMRTLGDHPDSDYCHVISRVVDRSLFCASRRRNSFGSCSSGRRHLLASRLWRGAL
jgi:hypothetical protein